MMHGQKNIKFIRLTTHQTVSVSLPNSHREYKIVVHHL